MPSAFSYLPLSALFAATMAVALVAGFQFEVGEKDGWREPIGKDRETYNQWASKKRFHIGDTLRKFSLHTFYTHLLHFAIMHFFWMYVDYGFCSSDFQVPKERFRPRCDLCWLLKLQHFESRVQIPRRQHSFPIWPVRLLLFHQWAA